jgi:hypothetical protein
MTPAPKKAPRHNEVYFVGREASVQFDGDRGIFFRLIRIQDQAIIADGWAWLEGYQVNDEGYAVERRVIYVLLSGLRRAQKRGRRYVRPIPPD